MNLSEKLEVAQALINLGVDIIEAGFPIASPGDYEAVREIATNFRGATICGLARCNEKDIDRAWDALKHSDDPRIHVFLATSAIHREFKLKMTPDEIIDRAVRGVRHAVQYCDNIEFSPEDAARTELDFLCQVVEKTIEGRPRRFNKARCFIGKSRGEKSPENNFYPVKIIISSSYAISPHWMQ